VSTKNLFAPDVEIEDARQRWLFRMIHTRRPLQEKMALFWHNHFATAYSKLVTDSYDTQATKMLAHKRGTLRGPQGQIELFREYALGNFRDLLLEVAQDPAMLVWLDGKFNTRARPQENFGREILELFTLGVGAYTEADVLAAARVFTGWNMRWNEGYSSDDRDDLNSYQEFVYNADQHDTGAKTFTFPIYRNGDRTIPARSESVGMQDGVDLINALATHPETARRLARKFWQFFVSDLQPPDPAFVESAAAVYAQSGTRIAPVVRFILTSRWFTDPSAYHARYSWPVEFVVRAIKEVGWQGFTLDMARSPLASMGQLLFEPPNVGGWPLGPGWFSTEHLAATLEPQGRTPQTLLAAMLDRLTPAPLDGGPQRALESYLVAGGAWTGGVDQLTTRAAGLARLLVASSEYQLV
jgi:uncharacterized protein (DUF1800 family)